MTFNIRHGGDGTNRYNLDSAIQTIAKVSPDVVGVQELTRNHPSYECDDQPARIADGLRAATGKAWNHVYHQEWFTPNTECRDRGQGDDRESEGLAFFSTLPLTGVMPNKLPYSALGLAVTINLGSARVPIVVTHLAANVRNRGRRVDQLGELLQWAEQLGAPRVLLGDFNARPEFPEMDPVFATYRDAWAEAVSAGTAKGVPDGATHKGNRIDYVLYVPGEQLELMWAETVDTRSLLGVEASDHEPVVAAFRLR